MAKLIIDCDKFKKDSDVAATAVYKTLGQKDKLKAELVFVSAERIKELNASLRGVDSVTDVLSFPTLDGIRGRVLRASEHPNDVDDGRLFIGSIAMCEDKVRSQAAELGHGEDRERTYLLVHALMHLFGYDHMTDEDKKEMRAKEKQALSLLGIEE